MGYQPLLSKLSQAINKHYCRNLHDLMFNRWSFPTNGCVRAGGDCPPCSRSNTSTTSCSGRHRTPTPAAPVRADCDEVDTRLFHSKIELRGAGSLRIAVSHTI